MTAVVGLDLSLRSTGLAILLTGDDGLESWSHRRIVSAGHEDATLAEREERLNRLSATICANCEHADLVVIESPAYASRTGHMHDRSGLWWLVVLHLFGAEIPVVDVAPTARAKYATGKGNASKDAVLAAVVRRYPEIDVSGNDEADALVLAAMGARHLGHPIDDLPKAHLDAMTKVAWPPREEAA